VKRRFIRPPMLAWSLPFGRAFGRRAERAERRFGRARGSPRPGRPPEDDRRPDFARAQATRPIFAVSLMSATSAFSSRSASFLNRTQALPMLAFGSRSTYRSAT
jgi:hypothetical protein